MLPSSIAELTPDWLTDALRPSGALGAGGRVTAVRADDIGTGVGVFGIIARLHLTYEGAPPDAPARLIAKIPTDAEANRQVGLVLRLYEREGRFYREVADSVSFRVPRCYLSEIDAEQGRFVILMEDMGHLEEGDQLAGITPARAGAVLDALAAFHAAWWESPRLAELDWVPVQNDPIYVAAVPPIVSAGVAALARFDGTLPDGSMALAQRVDGAFVELTHRCAAGPHTFVHGDARLDNLFFTPGTDEFALIDWQLSLRNRGVYDLVWLLATSMNVEDQAVHVPELVRRYHRALEANGVRWSFDDLRRAAAEQSAYLLSGPLSLIGTFDFAEAGDGRAAALTRKWVARGFNVALLLGAGDVL